MLNLNEGRAARPHRRLPSPLRCRAPLRLPGVSHSPGAAAPAQEQRPLPSPLPLVLGGRYRVEDRLGSGGMCLVYRAWHVFLRQPRAIKVLRDPSLLEERRRLLREARVGAAVQHENLVRVLDYGVLEDGQPFLVMEHLEGVTLREALAQGPLAPRRALWIAAQVAEALAALHRKGYLHRDVKPSNVMLTREAGLERATLLDLGLARRGPALAATPGEGDDDDRYDEAEVTLDGLIPGTPQYMAPEQRRGQVVGPAADQYALGCVLFELLTEEKLHGGAPRDAQATRALLLGALLPEGQEPGALQVQRALQIEGTLTRMLADAPQDRFESLSAVAAALRAAG